MTIHSNRQVLPWLTIVLLVMACQVGYPRAQQVQHPPDPELQKEEAAMNVHYLEIVTPDVDAMCRSLEQLHSVRFGEPVAALGNARTASIEGGGRIGVRPPMRETEAPVVRPYLLVDDITSSVRAAEEAGCQIALPPMELPGEGWCAIYFQGGIQHGLWQR